MLENVRKYLNTQHFGAIFAVIRCDFEFFSSEKFYCIKSIRQFPFLRNAGAVAVQLYQQNGMRR